MKSSEKLTWKDGLAVLIALLSMVGILAMWFAEPNTLTNATLAAYQQDVLPGLKKYSLAMGIILLTVSISYILLGRENDIDTSAEENE